MACAVEEAGFERRDQIQWLFASGFPKARAVAFCADDEERNDRKGRKQRQDAGQRVAPFGQPGNQGGEQSAENTFPDDVHESSPIPRKGIHAIQTRHGRA